MTESNLNLNKSFMSTPEVHIFESGEISGCFDSKEDKNNQNAKSFETSKTILNLPQFLTNDNQSIQEKEGKSMITENYDGEELFPQTKREKIIQIKTAFPARQKRLKKDRNISPWIQKNFDGSQSSISNTNHSRSKHPRSELADFSSFSKNLFPLLENESASKTRIAARTSSTHFPEKMRKRLSDLNDEFFQEDFFLPNKKVKNSQRLDSKRSFLTSKKAIISFDYQEQRRSQISENSSSNLFSTLTNQPQQEHSANNDVSSQGLEEEGEEEDQQQQQSTTLEERYNRLQYPLINFERSTQITHPPNSDILINGQPVDSETLYICLLKEFLDLPILFCCNKNTSNMGTMNGDKLNILRFLESNEIETFLTKKASEEIDQQRGLNKKSTIILKRTLKSFKENIFAVISYGVYKEDLKREDITILLPKDLSNFIFWSECLNSQIWKQYEIQTLKNKYRPWIYIVRQSLEEIEKFDENLMKFSFEERIWCIRKVMDWIDDKERQNLITWLIQFFFTDFIPDVKKKFLFLEGPPHVGKTKFMNLLLNPKFFNIRTFGTEFFNSDPKGEYYYNCVIFDDPGETVGSKKYIHHNSQRNLKKKKNSKRKRGSKQPREEEEEEASSFAIDTNTANDHCYYTNRNLDSEFYLRLAKGGSYNQYFDLNTKNGFIRIHKAQICIITNHAIETLYSHRHLSAIKTRLLPITIDYASPFPLVTPSSESSPFVYQSFRDPTADNLKKKKRESKNLMENINDEQEEGKDEQNENGQNYCFNNDEEAYITSSVNSTNPYRHSYTADPNIYGTNIFLSTNEGEESITENNISENIVHQNSETFTSKYFSDDVIYWCIWHAILILMEYNLKKQSKETQERIFNNNPDSPFVKFLLQDKRFTNEETEDNDWNEEKFANRTESLYTYITNLSDEDLLATLNLMT